MSDAIPPLVLHASSRSMRITGADFHTPPEFAGWKLAPEETGRIGGIRVELIPGQDGGACLGACFQQVPLRVMPPFHFGGGEPSLIYLINPTAGLLDGDGHLLELTVRAGVRAV